MLFSFAVDISGMTRRFSALVGAAEDLDEPLLRAGGRVRARTKRDVFGTEGQGRWPALTPATLAHKINEHESMLLGDTGRGRTGLDRSPVQRIVREAGASAKSRAREDLLRVRLAQRRQKGRKTEALARQVDVAVRRQAKAISYIRAYRHRAIAAGIGDIVAFARREVERAKAHGQVLRSYRAALKSGHRFSVQERRALLRQHARRYKASDKSTRILGGLEGSITMKLVEGKRVEIFSKAYIGAIHNEGGIAGHGAKIPKREFMFLVDSDIEFLVEVVREKMIKAWMDAAPAA